MRHVAATCLRMLTGLHADWRGCEPSPARRIYFANHTSNLDAPAIWSILPREFRETTRPVAANDYWSAGRIRRYLACHVFNAVLIEREHVTVRNNPVLKIREALEQGSSVIVFPEGTRSLTGEVGEFKSGLYHLIRNLPEIELIPVYLDNLNRILPKGEFIPVPLIARAVFGKPLELHAGEPRDLFLQRARAAVLGLSTHREDTGSHPSFPPVHPVAPPPSPREHEASSEEPNHELA